MAGSVLGVPFPFPLGMRLGGWPGPSSQRFAESDTAVSLRCRDAQRHSARGRVDCEPLVCVAFPLSATSRSGASFARAEHLRIRGKDPIGAARSAAAAPPFGLFVIRGTPRSLPPCDTVVSFGSRLLAEWRGRVSSGVRPSNSSITTLRRNRSRGVGRNYGERFSIAHAGTR